MTTMSNQQDDDMMEAVDLTKNNTTPPTKEQENDDDDIIGQSEEVKEETQEEEEIPIPSDADASTQAALSQLRASTANLGSAVKRASVTLDERLGVSTQASKVGSKMKQVDQDTGISQTARRASQTLGSWWNAVDDTLGVSQKTRQLGHSLDKAVVQPIASHPTVQQSKRNLMDFDQQHGITRSTASTLASGANALASGISAATETGQQENDDSMNQDSGRDL